MRRVTSYGELVEAIEAHREPPVYIVGDRHIQVRDLKLLCYVKPPPARHGFGCNVSIRCEAQWVMGTPYRSEEAKTAFFTALADVLHAVALVDSAIARVPD